MKDTSESLDHFMRSKLDEIKVDPSLTDTYWSQMQLPVVNQTGANKLRPFYWLGAFVLLITLMILIATKSSKNMVSNANTKLLQQPKKATSINMYDTTAMMNAKQTGASPIVTELHITKAHSSDKSGPVELFSPNNQPQNKPTDDSILNYQTTTTLHSLNQPKKVDTASLTKESLSQTSVQQADTNYKKIDSLSKKPDAKKKAPYIIW